MAAERVIAAIDARGAAFQSGLKSIRDPQLRREIIQTLQSLLLLNLDAVPAKLHLHQLAGKKVPSALETGKNVAAWTLHVTANDKYKASFTLEEGTVFLRQVGEHDLIDKRP